MTPYKVQGVPVDPKKIAFRRTMQIAYDSAVRMTQTEDSVLRSVVIEEDGELICEIFKPQETD